MPYSMSGTTITVSGTVDLTNVSLPSIFRINFAAGGTSATFNSDDFMAIPPQGIRYTVVGSASLDVLTIAMFDYGPPPPGGVLFPIGFPPDMSFFSFVNWSANDVVVIKGNSNNNYLSGSYAKDIFRGGNGDDTYDIGPGDIVDETGADGIDTIKSYWSVSLLSSSFRGVENVVLTAVDADPSAVGNALPNTLVGCMRNNMLNGLGGADVMQGRSGNDTYVVDTLNDIVDEGANNPGGLDTVLSYVSYTFLDTVHVKGAVENLTLVGAALEAEGNALNNTITGNGRANILKGLAGHDVLDGAAGVDELQGGTGNDTYVLGSEASGVDKVLDSWGGDTITSLIDRNLSFADYSEIENLVLLGNAVSGVGNGLDNVLNGDAGGNALSGLAGNDRLFGGAGKDSLTGGLGADSFVFNTPLNGSTNRDIVTDFVHGQDKFWLENAVMAKLGAGVHALSAAFFHAGPAAADANDYIVYNRATGVLSYDADGNGAGNPVAIALLMNKPVLTAGDFLVI